MQRNENSKNMESKIRKSAFCLLIVIVLLTSCTSDSLLSDNMPAIESDITFYTCVIKLNKNIQNDGQFATQLLNLGLFGGLVTGGQISNLQKVVDYCETNANSKYNGNMFLVAEAVKNGKVKPLNDDSYKKLASKLLKLQNDNFSLQDPVLQSKTDNKLVYTILELNTNISWIVNFVKNENSEWNFEIYPSDRTLKNFMNR